MIGDHIHYYVSHKILGRDPKLNKNILEDKYEIVKRCGEAILKKFVQPHVDRILGVEVNLCHPKLNNKKLRADLIAYCSEPYQDCSGGWGPTCIIDWKYIGKGKKFYFDNYRHQMSLYAQAYKEQQEYYHGPFLSHLLIVAVFHSGRIRIENYNDDYCNPVSKRLRKNWSQHEYR
jgi:predicted amidophosphoribosyltransferase